MHVFVTGATGWVGSEVVRELLDAGHSVSGLARSEEKAAVVAAAGAEPVIGTLNDLDTLKNAAVMADAVIHTAFDHDFSRFAENSEQERRALEAIGEALNGLKRRVLVTSGVAMITPGDVVTETDMPPVGMAIPRKAETVAQSMAERGVLASTVRLAPSVHGDGDHGFMAILIGIARQTGVSAYVGAGQNRWPAVHRLDVAALYRLALEHDHPMPVYHAIAEEGIAFSDIAEVIGHRLGLPVEPRERDFFGWFGAFAGADIPASSAKTRATLGWNPTGPGLLRDLEQSSYFAA